MQDSQRWSCARCRGYGLVPGANGENATYCTCPAGVGVEEEEERRSMALREHVELQRRWAWNEIGLPPRVRDFSFESWPGATDKLGKATRAVVRRFVEEGDPNGKKWLLMTGECGSGKTGLAVAALRHSFERATLAGPPPSYRFVTASRLLDLIKAGYDASRRGKPLDEDPLLAYQEADLLVLDDVGAEKPSEWVRDRYFALLNARYDSQLPTYITTNLKMAELEEAITGRVLWRVREVSKILSVDGRNLHDRGAIASRTGARRLRSVQ